jgi:hypothetical protein
MWLICRSSRPCSPAGQKRLLNTNHGTVLYGPATPTARGDEQSRGAACGRSPRSVPAKYAASDAKRSASCQFPQEQRPGRLATARSDMFSGRTAPPCQSIKEPKSVVSYPARRRSLYFHNCLGATNKMLITVAFGSRAADDSARSTAGLDQVAGLQPTPLEGSLMAGCVSSTSGRERQQPLQCCRPIPRIG